MNEEMQPEIPAAEESKPGVPANGDRAGETPAPNPAGESSPAAAGDAVAEDTAAPAKPVKERARRPRRKKPAPVEAPTEEPAAPESAAVPVAEAPILAADPLAAAAVAVETAAAPVLDEPVAPSVVTVPEALVLSDTAETTVIPEASGPVELPASFLEEASAAEAELPLFAAAVPDLDDVEADPLLLRLAEREVIAVGEPIPLLNRDTRGKDGLLDLVLVPEATLETPPDRFLDFPVPPAQSTLAANLALPPITPELLAEVREEARREGRKPKPPRPPRGPRPEAPVPAPVPAPVEEPEPPAVVIPPDLVLVPEATLETVPEEWLAEEEEGPEGPEGTLESVFPGAPGGGRRRRRRGRDRDRRAPEEPRAEVPAAPTTPAVPATPAATPVLLAPSTPTATPVVTVLRPDDESARADREKRDREVRTEREFKEILVNVGDRETRIAVLENGRLVELHVEREERVVGGVYKGKVCNVLPGMDAAFVDIGLERNAFLYVGDILFEDQGRHGEGGAPVRRTSRDVRIKDVAKPGQELMVQVVKGPRGTKGARVSTKMSIPGRYLVLMPEGDHLGVSRKIEDARERDRLKKIADQIQPKGFGVIVRTEAEGRTDQELRQDLDYLMNTWQRIVDKNKKAHAPALLHKDLGLILKTIRDLFGSDVDRLVIDDAEEFEKVQDTLEQLAPDLLDRVVFFDEPEPLFIKYNVEEEIDRLLRRKVWLRNGAYLLLDTTEALTTIDVNTGKFVGTSSLAETILKTNLDAVDEIARQLRLRDIGGMIVLDFIDMASSRDRQLVMRALENAFKKDRTRTKIAHISPLGLVEMTRKRTAENVTDVMTDTCPYCQGRGRVWSPETMAINVEREIRRLCSKQDVEAILVHASPDVAAHLIGPEGEGVEQLERLIRRPVYIRGRSDYHIEKFDVHAADMLEMEREMMPYHGGQVVDCRVVKMELVAPPRSAAWMDGYFVDLANGARYQGQTLRVRLTDVRRSFALGEPVPPSTSVDRSEPI